MIHSWGGYYSHQGVISQNDTSDYIIIDHFVVQKGLLGTVAMGDELNTETCTEDDIPSYMEFWFEVDTLAADNTSSGWVELEIYRQKTVII